MKLEHTVQTIRPVTFLFQFVNSDKCWQYWFS